MRAVKISLRATLSAAAAVATINMFATPAFAAEPFIPGFGPALNGGSVVLKDQPARVTPAAGGACAIAFRSTIAAKGKQLWYVNNLPHSYTLGWYVMADTTSPGPSVSLLTTATQQTDSAHTTYWLGVINYAATTQTFEMRVCVS